MKILIQDPVGLRRLEEGYASEFELQTFLKTYPDLMPLEEIDLSAPPLLCIGWEVGVVSGAEDILYIDEAGLLTLVETKLRRNPEARRAVVGQVLEYAAHMSAWTAADVQQIAERFFASDQCPEGFAGFTFEKALQAGVTKLAGDYELFLERVQVNINQGRFRLIIAIDEIPESLLRTVKFVNRFSEHFDLYLIQLKRFRDAASEQNVFVPALFGAVSPVQTSTARSGRRRDWDEESFLERLHEQAPETDVATVEALLRITRDADRISWGHGATYGTFGYVVPFGKGVMAFSCNTAGKILLDFQSMNAVAGSAVTVSFKEDLKRVGPIPETVINTLNWREFQARLLVDSSVRAIFVSAARHLEELLTPSSAG